MTASPESITGAPPGAPPKPPANLGGAAPAPKAPPPKEPRAINSQIPLIDGLTIDVVVLNFAGSIELDKSKKADIDLLDKLMLGNDVEITVAAYVSASNGKAPRNKEGDLKEVRKAIGLKVHSVTTNKVSVTSKP